MTQKLGSARNGTQIGYKQAQYIIRYAKALPVLPTRKAAKAVLKGFELGCAYAQGQVGFTECVPAEMQRECLAALVRLSRTYVRFAQASAKPAGQRPALHNPAHVYTCSVCGQECSSNGHPSCHK